MVLTTVFEAITVGGMWGGQPNAPSQGMVGDETITRYTLAFTGVVALLLVFSLTATAQSPFEDVPDDHVFAEDVAWLKDERITIGCNPPENTLFCPDDNITRGEEAAFFHRLAGSRAVDAGWLGGHPAIDCVLGDDLDDSISDWIDENGDSLKGEKGDPGSGRSRGSCWSGRSRGC